MEKMSVEGPSRMLRAVIPDSAPRLACLGQVCMQWVAPTSAATWRTNWGKYDEELRCYLSK